MIRVKVALRHQTAMRTTYSLLKQMIRFQRLKQSINYFCYNPNEAKPLICGKYLRSTYIYENLSLNFTQLEDPFHTKLMFSSLLSLVIYYNDANCFSTG